MVNRINNNCYCHYMSRMSRLLLVLVTVVLCLHIVSGQLVDPTTEVICNPDNARDCYPKIFVPTEEWQVIKPNQDIPPGLHVRLNIDTLQKEAKLMDPSDIDSSDYQVVAREPESNEDDDKNKQDMRSAIKSKIEEAKAKRSESRKVEQGNFGDSVEEVKNPSSDNENLQQALETLIELSHDIEFGAKLTEDPSIFAAFEKLIESSENDVDIREKSYRIMASSLRNNPKAVENIMENKSDSFTSNLIQNLENEKSPVIQKRILGLLQALLQDKTFKRKFFDVKQGHDESRIGFNIVVNVFPNLKEDVKTRAAEILSDSTTSETGHENNDFQSPDEQFSKIIQSILINKEYSQVELMLYFRKLTDIHEQNKSLKPEKKFVEWLAARAAMVSDPNQKRNESPDEKEFNNEFIKKRHLVYGNPNALRKSMALDEL